MIIHMNHYRDARDGGQLLAATSALWILDFC